MENSKRIGELELHDYALDPLKANETWTSKSESSLETGRIAGTVFSDVGGTLYVEQSGDGLSWDVVDTVSVSGGTGAKFSYEKVTPHARVRYVNGGTDQRVFRLYVFRRIRML